MRTGFSTGVAAPRGYQLAHRWQMVTGRCFPPLICTALYQ